MSFESCFLCFISSPEALHQKLYKVEAYSPSTIWNHLIKRGEMMVPLQFSDVLPHNMWHEKVECA
jgi:hypothetical protein